MITAFKSALDRVRADGLLKQKTQKYLTNTITSNENPITKNNSFFKRIVAVACTVILLCATSIGANAYYKTPTSYLSLDINPSVELGVNAFGKVVSATGYNNDGKAILKGKNVINSGVKDAVNTLVKSAAQKGFIEKDGSTVIAVTAETDRPSIAAKLNNEAEQGVNTAVESEGDTATVQKENVALERRDEAKELGITPGKLNLIEKLQALDPSITVDQYKDATVTDIMNKYVELKKETLPQKGKSGNSNSTSSDDVSSTSSESTMSQSNGSKDEKSGSSSVESSQSSTAPVADNKGKSKQQ